MASRPFAIVAGTLVVACIAVSRALTGGPSSSSTAPWAARQDFVCPVTTPNGETYRFEPEGGNHGAHGIIAAIPVDGRLRFRPGGPGFVLPDGALSMKFRWWRRVRGPVLVEGGRLDAPASPLRAVVAEGYGDSGFQPMSLVFPTPGCWRITVRVGASSLTMTLSVEKFGTGPMPGTYVDRDVEPTPECARQLADLADDRWPPVVRPRPEVRALIDAMRSAAFIDASRAGDELTRLPELGEGTSLRDVQALLGKADARYPGSLSYKTNGGPLEFGFRDCRLVYKAMTRPGSWSGSDEQLAALWAKARHTRQWTQWEPMTGRLWPASNPSGHGVEVELNGGFYGSDGQMSFSMPTEGRCAGKWRAALGGESPVTSGELIRTLGPKYMPRYRRPYMPRYQLPDRLESWQSLGRADVTCDSGRSLRFEFLTGPGEAHGWGIAIDDRRTVYRFFF